jgi:hypothetical protein
MKFTLRTLRIEAKKIGATVDDSTLRSGFINVDAPIGKVWACDGSIHALCVWVNIPDHSTLLGDRPDTKYRQESIQDALERMAYGLEDCTEPNCDVCEENRAQSARLDTVPAL